MRLSPGPAGRRFLSAEGCYRVQLILNCQLGDTLKSEFTHSDIFLYDFFQNNENIPKACYSPYLLIYYTLFLSHSCVKTIC